VHPKGTNLRRTFQSLLTDLSRGDAKAGEELFRRYGDLLLQVVRRHLNPALRRQVDSLDFVQDAWVALLHKPSEEWSFDSPEQLARFLATVARNKVIDAARHRLYAGDGMRREVALDARPPSDPCLMNAHSTPSKAAMLKEFHEYLLEGMRPVHQEVGRILLEGKDPQQIADDLGVGRRMVERVRERIVKRLQTL
jgi:RNA polymerase sigma factor (sigma-70 family)